MKFFLLLICLTFNAYADQLVLSEADVVRLAIERNENIGIAQSELLRANKVVNSVSSDLFPLLSAKIGMQKGSSTGSFVPNGDDWSESASVTLSQPIYSFGRLGSAVDIAEASLSLSQNQKLATEAEVIKTARQLYYSVLYGQALVNITDESYENALKNKETLEKRVSYGRISQNDNLKMQADIASRKPRLIDAQKSLAVYELELMNFLAIPSTSTIKVIGSLENIPHLSSTVLDDKKLDSLAEVRILQDSLIIGQKTVELARADRMPTLSAFGTYAPTTYKDDFLGSEVKKQENITVGVSLTFEWPFGGGKNDEVEIKKIERRIAELRLEAGRRNNQTRFNALTKQFDSLKDKLEAELNAVRLARSSYRVALNAFSTGSISQLQLNDSELLLTQNRMSLATTQLELHNLSAEFERLITKGNEG